MQAVAANVVREQKETKEVTPLRLPKHLQESARADNAMSSEVKEQTLLTTAPAVETAVSDNTEPSADTELYNEDSYTEVESEVHEDQDYEDEEDYNAYYQEVSYYLFQSIIQSTLCFFEVRVLELMSCPKIDWTN